MSARETHLHVVAPCALDEAAASELGDLGLTATIFAVGLLPIACDLAGVGRWGASSLGLGTMGVLLAGRELGGWARRALSGSGRAGPPARRPRGWGTGQGERGATRRARRGA